MNLRKDYSKDTIQKELLELYSKFGYISIQLIMEKAHISRHVIDTHWGNFQSCCDALNLPYKNNKTKSVNCERCDKSFEISKYALDDFERFCDHCKIVINNEQYDGLFKDQDYVECPACGFRALSLEGHYRKDAKSWRKCPYTKEQVEEKYGLLTKIKADICDVEAKETRRENGWFQDRDSSIAKFSASGGHALGKTKENCEWVKRISDIKIEQYASGELVPAGKGKTKDNYEPLMRASEKIKEAISKRPDWGKWSEKKITEEQLQNFFDNEGKLKLKEALLGLGISGPTIKKFQKKYGIKTSREASDVARRKARFSDNMAEARKLSILSGGFDHLDISRESIESFKDDKGVNVDLASAHLDVTIKPIIIRCKRWGIPYYRKKHNSFQYRTLEMVSKIICESYTQEFTFEDIIYQDTQILPRYDGYFEKSQLVVEVNGSQHYLYNKYFFKTVESWQDYLVKCEFKKQAIIKKGLRFIEISCFEKVNRDSIISKLKEVGLLCNGQPHDILTATMDNPVQLSLF